MSDPGAGSGGTQILSPPPLRPAWKDWRVWIIVALAAISIPAYRAARVRASTRAASEGAAMPTVAVDRVQREDLSQEITREAELRPYQEIDVHAKVAGFLDSILVDIGDRVTNGQVFAKLEIPELKDEMDGATATHQRNLEEVGRAKAAYEDAHQAFTRMTAVDKANPAFLAGQELDSAQAKDLAASSAVSAAQAQVEVSKAEMHRLHTLQAYTQISAPFAGVVTKRYADRGALIQAGTSSSTQTMPIVRLSQNDLLRLSIPISVTYVPQVRVGDPVLVTVDSIGVKLTGRIARMSGNVDASTRTMETEVDVPNQDLHLVPGMYAEAHLRLAHRDHTLSVPIQAVALGDPSSVVVVDSENKIEVRQVKTGLETPYRLEILEGLKEGDLVMIGDRARVSPGQRVKPKLEAEPNPAP